MLQQTVTNSSNMVQIVTLICGCVITCFTAWIAYKQSQARQVSDQHTTQIQEVKALVNGSLGQTLQTGLTAAKALVEANPAPANITLAEDAQKALDAHVATQAAINQSIATGAKLV